MKDLFSNHARQYAAFRPTYPQSLYNFILSFVNEKENAWDCGCGNGQVAFDLSRSFKSVFATDISSKQMENAVKAENIFYSVSKAEHTQFADSTFDLITVGQALHWFNITEFFEEVKRVGKLHSVVAVWGYGLLTINDKMNKHLLHFYTEIVGPFWDKERRLIDEGYENVAFPFKEIRLRHLTFLYIGLLINCKDFFPRGLPFKNLLPGMDLTRWMNLCKRLSPIGRMIK